MRLKMSQILYCLIFLLFMPGFNPKGLNPFTISPVYASETNTTLYLGSVEKNLESGETKVYYQAGTASVVRTIKQDGTSTVSYLHSDHLGSTILITNDKGNVQGSTLAYYPYGQLTINNQQLTTDQLYTGQKKDSSSDLYFYNARYYNPKTAHFVSADKAEGGNRYAYVANNPVMRSDPSGNMIFEPGENWFKNYLQVYNPNDPLALAMAEKFQDAAERLITQNSELLKGKNSIYIIITRPGDETAKLYKFMHDMGFSGMTHEDITETNKYSCYPMCQFYTIETANSALNSNLNSDSYSYADVFAEKLLPHEFTHNLQSINNPDLASTFHPGFSFESTNTSVGWQSPYRGFMEGAADIRYKAGGGYYKAQVKSLTEVTKAVQSYKYLHNLDTQDGSEIGYKQLQKLFKEAKSGSVEAYNYIRLLYGPEVFDKLFY